MTDPEEFAGRSEQLQDIDYYLDLARSDNPIFVSMALIGNRAAGKTSLLHMAESHAEQRGLISVRITLDDETSSNDVLFFKELLDSIVTAGVKRGMYGGVASKVYRNFRRALDTLDLNAEIPFLFGTVYIGRKKHDAEARVPQHVIVTDLQELRRQSAKIGIPAIVILLDECDLLSKSRILLQKIRNVFSEVPGYLLVFSGTAAMFPAISDVFSPVPRLFKRVDVGNFRDVQEVADCVLKPLPAEERALVHPAVAEEVFKLTGGSPYEVKLVSHFMYKRFRQVGAPQMTLSAEVLDDVFGELDRFRTPGHARLLDGIRACTEPDLRQLAAVLEFGRATLAQLVAHRALDHPEDLTAAHVRKMGEDITRLLAVLRERGLLVEERDAWLFPGDEFDAMYLKYYCAARGISYSAIPPLTPTGPIQTKITSLLFESMPSYRIHVRFDRSPDNPHQLFIIGGKFQFPPGRSEVSLGSPEEWERSLYAEEEDAFRFRVNLPVLRQGFLCRVSFGSKAEADEARDKVLSWAGHLAPAGIEITFDDEVTSYNRGTQELKSGQHGEALQFFTRSVEINPSFELAWAQRSMTLRAMRKFDEAIDSLDRALAIVPRWPVALVKKGDVLLEMGKVDEAHRCYDRALALDPVNLDALVSKGHAFSVVGNHREALRLYEQACVADETSALAWSNRSNALLRLERLKEALVCAEKALELDPSHRLGAVNKALVLLQMADFGEALICSEEALASHPTEPLLWFVAGEASLRRGNFAKAVDAARHAIEHGAHLGWPWLLLGEAQLNLGQEEDAVKSLRRAIELDPVSEGKLSEEAFNRVRGKVLGS